jgi:2,3,4,5-tetrahydropyridine-2,6-dicarboxylate N-succinyltransferase
VSLVEDLAARVERSWLDTAREDGASIDREAVEATIGLLDRGELRVAQPDGDGIWTVNAWAKQAVLLYFRVRGLETTEAGPFEYRDKLPLKHGYDELGVRVVPPATVRFGAHLEPGVVLMPSYVNIGAYVGSGTMVDTWATVGSCAQIGTGVHLSGGVGIGGVLEPLQAAPVVVEDGAFIGSRCIVVEGVHVGRRAVLGAGVVLTANTPVIDPRGDAPVEYRGHVPPGAIVVPGTRPKSFPAGDYGMPCGLIIGERTEATDDKVQLNDLLRDAGSSTG